MIYVITYIYVYIYICVDDNVDNCVQIIVIYIYDVDVPLIVYMCIYTYLVNKIIDDDWAEFLRQQQDEYF